LELKKLEQNQYLERKKNSTLEKKNRTNQTQEHQSCSDIPEFRTTTCTATSNLIPCPDGEREKSTGSRWHKAIGREWIGHGCKDSQSRASPNPIGGRRFAATSARDNFVYSLKRQTRQLAHESHTGQIRHSLTTSRANQPERDPEAAASNGHPQRRHGDHRRRPRHDLQAKRSRYARHITGFSLAWFCYSREINASVHALFYASMAMSSNHDELGR
jgi:hypothetical protein